MIDVDDRGRREAELLREEAARIADTEEALQSVLAGESVVPLEVRGPARSRIMVAHRPGSRRRWIVAGIAAAAAVVVVLVVLRRSDEPGGTPADRIVTPATELAIQPLDPPIVCEEDLCPSLAVMEPEGTLVAYDQAARTLTRYFAEPWVLPVTVDPDAEDVQLEAVDGFGGFVYFRLGSPGTESGELVAIDPSGEVVRRVAISSADLEPSTAGLVERLCWSDCERPVGSLLPWVHAAGITYPDVTHAAGTVTVQLGERRWEIAWPDMLSTRSQFAPRWDGGVVLSLLPESGDRPGELIELLPDGSIERFRLDEAVHVLLLDGSAVVWRDGQLVRVSPPRPAEPPAAWSPELAARPLEFPTCFHSPSPPLCPPLAVAPEGTLVAYDPETATLTWYEDDPRVVPTTAELSDDLELVAIGPHDVAYFLSWGPNGGELVAVAPSGAEITRAPVAGHPMVIRPTPSGLVRMACTFIRERCTGGTEWPLPDAPLVLPWVDLAGNPIVDTRPYPVAKGTDSGIEVRFGDREWLLSAEPWSGHQMPEVFPRSDGGVVMLHDLSFYAPSQPNESIGQPTESTGVPELFELLPDGSIERYFVRLPSGLAAPHDVLPDGSVIVEVDNQLFRLSPSG